MYDVLHDVENRVGVIAELLRVLKSGGVLSYRDHHLSVEEAFGKILGTELTREETTCEAPVNLVRA